MWSQAGYVLRGGCPRSNEISAKTGKLGPLKYAWDSQAVTTCTHQYLDIRQFSVLTLVSPPLSSSLVNSHFNPPFRWVKHGYLQSIHKILLIRSLFSFDISLFPFATLFDKHCCPRFLPTTCACGINLKNRKTKTVPVLPVICERKLTFFHASPHREVCVLYDLLLLVLQTALKQINDNNMRLTCLHQNMTTIESMLWCPAPGSFK